jgi:hypothetical protein
VLARVPARLAKVVTATCLLAACQATSTPATAEPGASAPASDTAAQQYCTDQGGRPVTRAATFNTNGDPTAWVPLAGVMTFCEFETGTGDQTSRISVDLTTLSSTQPTLASVAYLSKVPPKPGPPGGNPAVAYCNDTLGGSSTFGPGASGGGWLNNDEPVFKVMDECVFADMSAIDAFGLLYHSQGTIRGADLATRFRYQPDNQLPAVYPQ